jgi:hypothetical protein
MTAWHRICYADCLARTQPFDLDLIWASIGLVVVLLIGYVIVEFYRSRLRGGDSEENTAGGSLSFRELYERGEISKEEYERILQRMGQRLRSNPSVPLAPGVSPGTGKEEKLPSGPAVPGATGSEEPPKAPPGK